MRVSVFGLGYVGSVSVGCLSSLGHEVIGVDVNPLKVKLISEKKSPVIEPGLDELFKDGVGSGKIRVTTDAQEAILNSEISLICVGTPSLDNGGLNLDYVEQVCQDIGQSLREKDGFHIIVVRSTMLPGSCESKVIPTIEQASGLKAGDGFGLCFNPEFLREGSAVKDFFEPPYTLIGEFDEGSAKVLAELYKNINAPVRIVPLRVAEMVKYANNAFHALKVVFANEIGNVSKKLDIDSHQVMEIFCLDDKLNLSPYYLKPGFAFGGSCLPKDLRALLQKSKRLDIRLPVLESILPSNQLQIDRAVDLIRKTGKKKIGILGFSFKAGTDDLRESPQVELIETLLGKGYSIKIFDKNVSLAKLYGANREYIERVIPHISSLMANTIEEIVSDCDVIVIGNKTPEFKEVVMKLRPDQVVIDLVRITSDISSLGSNYQGICW